MISRVSAFLGLAFLATLITSCDETDFRNGNVKNGMPRLNITDAANIVVLESTSGSGGRIKAASTNLYKITTDGSFQEVKFLNADNTEVDPGQTETLIKINNAFNLNAKYLLLEGEFTAWDTLGNTQSYNALLVRKTDGAIYDFSNPDIAYNSAFFEDEVGNIYYRNHGQMVMQIDVGDPSLLKRTEYLAAGQTATTFCAGGKGNVLYEYRPEGMINDDEIKYRVRKAQGGIYEIDITEPLDPGHYKYWINGMWTGTNGKIYFDSHTHDGNGYTPHIHTLTVDNTNTAIIDTVWTSSDPGANPIGWKSSQMHRVPKEESMLFVSKNQAWEFFEDTNEMEEVSLPEADEIDDFFYTDEFVYYRSGVDIHKISLDDYNAELVPLPQDDQFEIYSLSGGDNEVLNLSALRFSDGKKIIAQIDAEGTFTVLDEVVNKEAVVMQRLD